jgi:protein tyrosine phosphatase
MVWEQNTTVIVMLTRLMEAGRTKAHVYWPTNQGQPQMFGNILVTLLEEQTNEFYKVRKFRVESNNISREITHFHYTDWPDFGVPKTTMGILRLCYHTNECSINGGPMIVHCSAGIGRSGSFIGIHYLISSSETNSNFFLSNITVLELTKKMRQQRPGMVQTVDQYRFIYQAVNDFVKASLRMNNSEGMTSKSDDWRLSAERLQTMITALV